MMQNVDCSESDLHLLWIKTRYVDFRAKAKQGIIIMTSCYRQNRFDGSSRLVMEHAFAGAAFLL